VHVAGSHLEDPATGEFNLPFLREEFPGEDFSVVTFARWEEGLVIAAGNPKDIRKIDDLARKNVKFVNREPGSGSRGLLDKLLQKTGWARMRFRGMSASPMVNLAAAYCVMSHEADVCLATRSAAQTFGLDFIALHSERYDLVMRRQTAEFPAAKAFLDVLQRATLRRKLEVLPGTIHPRRECWLHKLFPIGFVIATGLMAADFDWKLPKGFPSPTVPADNPMSAAKVELGRRLFYDKRMSVNGKMSCASCHRQELAFTDGRAHAEGTTGEPHPRSSMSLVNVAYVPFLTWANPTLTSLEEQALVPMLGEAPIELGPKREGAGVPGPRARRSCLSKTISPSISR